jgi:flagellum-specific peptidoglycan hydrolase FlgJ
MCKKVGGYLSKLELKWVLFSVGLMISLYNFGQSRQEVYNELVKQGVKYPKIVLAQSLLETGNYKCTNCSKDVNNLFGFFWKGSYIAFDNWRESVDYYKRWQLKRYNGGDYYAFLKRIGYAADPNYIRKVKEIAEALPLG